MVPTDEEIREEEAKAQAEAEAKAQAERAAAPSVLVFGGFCRAALDAYDTRKAELAAEAAERAEKSKPTEDQEAERHQRNAISALNALDSDSTPVAVVHAIRYAELAGIPEAEVEIILKARGFNRARCEALLKALKTAQV